MTDLNLYRAGPSGADARLGLVMVHGRGAGAGDILGLWKHLALPDVAAVAPEAPGRSWWPTSFLAPMDQMGPYVETGLAAVDASVKALQDQGLPRDRIGVVGFSQGACLALEYAARSGSGLLGAFGLSGGLVGTGDAGGPSDALYGFAGKSFDYDTDLAGLPVWISVHDRDPHIPLKRVEDSRDVLAQRGAEIRTKVYPGAGHGVMADDMSALRAGLNT